MKTIMMSIKPRYVKDILNGIKTIEIRKRFPKDYVGWVYIYVTKGKPYVYDLNRYSFAFTFTDKRFIKSNHLHMNNKEVYQYLNGKVVARFWCDKVEEAYKFYVEELCQLACVTKDELYKYAGGWYNVDDLLAIHIAKLEIFDKPKEISEFKYYKKFSEIDYMLPIPRKETCERLVPLTRAPQSWQWIEVL